MKILKYNQFFFCFFLLLALLTVPAFAYESGDLYASYCSKCGKYLDFVLDYQSKEPTCTSSSYWYGNCSVCGNRVAMGTPKSASKPVYGTIRHPSGALLWNRRPSLKYRNQYQIQPRKNLRRLPNLFPPLWRRQKHPSVPGGGRPSTRVRSRRLIFRQPRIIFINYKEETNHGTYEKGIERSGSSARQ